MAGPNASHWRRANTLAPGQNIPCIYRPFGPSGFSRCTIVHLFRFWSEIRHSIFLSERTNQEGRAKQPARSHHVGYCPSQREERRESIVEAEPGTTALFCPSCLTPQLPVFSAPMSRVCGVRQTFQISGFIAIQRRRRPMAGRGGGKGLELEVGRRRLHDCVFAGASYARKEWPRGMEMAAMEAMDGRKRRRN